MSASPEFTLDQTLQEDDDLRTLMSGMLSGAYREEIYLADVTALCRSRPLAGARLLALIERYHRLGRMAEAQYRTVRAAIESTLDIPPQTAASPLAPEPGLQRWTLDPDLTRDLSAVAPDLADAAPMHRAAAPLPAARQAPQAPAVAPEPGSPSAAAASTGGPAAGSTGGSAARRHRRGAGPALVIEAAEESGSASGPERALQKTVLLPSAEEAPARRKQPEPALAAGRVLHQRYELLSLLGRGGMGSVFRAVDRLRVNLGVPNCEVAVKVLKPGRSAAESAAALAREFSTAQQLSHPNIVNVYDLDHDGELAFYTMELLEGVRLSELIARAGQRLPRAQALSILRQVGAAVAHAHARGVAHGDLKPHNIMVGPGGDVRVLDFGAASVVLREPWISDGPPGDFRPATPAYASCEQLEGHQAEPRDDLYSLGCIGYLLLSGRHPFDNLSAIQARAQGRKPVRPPGLDAARWRALRRALGWTRAQRSFGVEEWLAQMGLEQRADAAASGAPREPRLTHPARPARAARAARGAPLRLVATWMLLAIGIGMAALAVSRLRAPGMREASAALAALLGGGQRILGAAPQGGTVSAPPALARATPPSAAGGGTASPGHTAVVGPAGAAAALLSAPTPAAAAGSGARTAGAGVAPGGAHPAAPASRSSGAGQILAASSAASEPPHAAFTTSHYAVSGDSPAAQIVIRRAGGSTERPIRFLWWTVPGSAKPNVDYASLGRRTGRIAPGRASVSVFVPIISNPLLHGRSEFSVALDTLSGSTPQAAAPAPAAAQNQATVTIERGG